MGQRQRQKKIRSFDYSLLFIIVFLLGFGLVMIYSTSSYNAQIKFNDAEFYFKKQIKAVIIGVVLMYAAYRFDYHWLKKFALPIFLLAITFIVLIIPFGIEANGAKRWLGIGSLSFQPAEFAKLALIIFATTLICGIGKNMKKFRSVILIWVVASILAVMILLITNNMSSALIILGIAVVMTFVAYPGYKIFSMLAALCVSAFVVFYSWLTTNIHGTTDNFRFKRLLVWLDPEKYASGTGFQTVQALYAIGSGGLFGKGLGKSLQKLGFIPEAQNDMIFSVICEELGLFGALCIIIIFALMLWRFVYIATNAPDLFGSLLTMGVFAHIAIQVILNIAVVTNLIPNTGISLPFISYGGTSVAFLLVEMGIVLNVSSKIKIQ